MSDLVLPNTSIDNVKMVVFDKDGTLIDVHHYWCSMIEFRAEFFVRNINTENKLKVYNELVDSMGIDLKTKKMKAEGPVGIKPRKYIINTAYQIMKKYDSLYTIGMVENIFTEVDEYSKTKLSIIVKALPNVEATLQDLQNAGIQISIATTDLTLRARLAMESLNLDKYFLDIVGADLVESAKPSADLIEYILDKYNLIKEDIVLVGDSMADLGMAKNVKCRFIGVKSGLYNDEFIQESENVIDDLRDLKVCK